MQLPDNIGRLLTIIKRGATDPAHGAFLWVGAGLSIPAGYPSWTQLIERLRGASVEPLQDVSDPLQAIDAFVRVNGTGLLSQQLQDIFEYKPPLLYHQELIQLPWKGIITTNYDELLEDALKRCGEVSVGSGNRQQRETSSLTAVVNAATSSSVVSQLVIHRTSAVAPSHT